MTNLQMYYEWIDIFLYILLKTDCRYFIVPRLLEEKRRDIVFGFPSVRPVFPSLKVLCTLCAQLLLQFYADSFETLQMLLSWSEDMHVVWILS